MPLQVVEAREEHTVVTAITVTMILQKRTIPIHYQFFRKLIKNFEFYDPLWNRKKLKKYVKKVFYQAQEAWTN